MFAGEVVLCGGTMGTPHVLQLSGIGPADVLERVGVPVVLDLPAVGENLEDHLAVHMQHRCTKPVSLLAMRKKYRWPGFAAQWLLTGTGPGASNHQEATGFYRSDETQDRPDIMMSFAALAMRSEEGAQVDGHGYQMHVGVMRSEARGSVHLRSANPAVHPAIRCNYLSGASDRDRWVRGIAIARDLLCQPAFAELDGGEVLPGPRVVEPDEVMAWVSRAAQTGLHPSGTARMGRGENSVVDPRDMRVHGITGLRVADASAMPSLTNGNTYAPTMALAEKAADLILGNTPLSPGGRVRPCGPAVGDGADQDRSGGRQRGVRATHRRRLLAGLAPGGGGGGAQLGHAPGTTSASVSSASTSVTSAPHTSPRIRRRYGVAWSQPSRGVPAP